MSCCQAARLVPRDFDEHDEGIDGVDSIHDEDRSSCSTRLNVALYGLANHLVSCQHLPDGVFFIFTETVVRHHHSACLSKNAAYSVPTVWYVRPLIVNAGGS